jgi:hypothetical protein
MVKSKKIFALTLIVSLIVVAAFASIISAQSQATVNILASIGGTTDPAEGTHTYNDGTSVTFTATPDSTSVFSNWIISIDAGSATDPNSEITIPVTGGTTYDIQAVFAPLLPPPGVASIPSNLATAAIVIVLAGAGGTTTPVPGTYALADATSLQLTATPLSGWTFSHWVIAGPNLSHGGYPYTAQPTNNPYTVDHGYGNTFSYQPVFTPEGTTAPTPTIPEFSSIATIIVALALVAIAFGTYTFRRRTK